MGAVCLLYIDHGGLVFAKMFCFMKLLPIAVAATALGRHRAGSSDILNAYGYLITGMGLGLPSRPSLHVNTPSLILHSRTFAQNLAACGQFGSKNERVPFHVQWNVKSKSVDQNAALQTLIAEAHAPGSLMSGDAAIIRKACESVTMGKERELRDVVIEHRVHGEQSYWQLDPRTTLRSATSLCMTLQGFVSWS